LQSFVNKDRIVLFFFLNIFLSFLQVWGLVIEDKFADVAQLARAADL
tara:strand:+ start:2609 stop:2749 length:141 start_codon:yes stop_codon:yes gene_type:complete